MLKPAATPVNGWAPSTERERATRPVLRPARLAGKASASKGGRVFLWPAHNRCMDANLQSLTLQLREFAAARDWAQFHSPKNLACALSVEAAELLEHFQWLTPEQSRNLDAAAKDRVGQEIADVLLYLLQLADQLGLDPASEANRKLALNALKYPVDLTRGKAGSADPATGSE